MDSRYWATCHESRCRSVTALHNRFGNVEAPDDATAIERGAAEFKVPAKRLMALRRS
jgi:hypothetical protein